MPDDIPLPTPPNLGDFFNKQNQPENGFRAVKYYREFNIPKIVQWTMKLSGGLIKDARQAAYVLAGLVVLMVIVSLFLFFGSSGRREEKSLEERFPPGSSALIQ